MNGRELAGWRGKRGRVKSAVCSPAFPWTPLPTSEVRMVAVPHRVENPWHMGGRVRTSKMRTHPAPCRSLVHLCRSFGSMCTEAIESSVQTLQGCCRHHSAGSAAWVYGFAKLLDSGLCCEVSRVPHGSLWCPKDRKGHRDSRV